MRSFDSVSESRTRLIAPAKINIQRNSQGQHLLQGRVLVLFQHNAHSPSQGQAQTKASPSISKPTLFSVGFLVSKKGHGPTPFDRLCRFTSAKVSPGC